MANAASVVAYAYKAAIYCPNCIVQEVANSFLVNPDPETGSWTKRPYDTETCLRWLAANAGINCEDERTYDSDDFPKVVFGDQVWEEEHCSNCHERID
jgi:hypothetical protein